MNKFQNRKQQLTEKIDIEVAHHEALVKEIFEYFQELTNSSSDSDEDHKNIGYEVMELLTKLPPQLSGGIVRDVMDIAHKFEFLGEPEAEKVKPNDWSRFIKLINFGVENIDSQDFYKKRNKYKK
jgi:hypothetical protein